MPNALSNSDLQPVSQDKRNWTSLNYFSLWAGMSISIPTYMLGSSLVEGGMTGFQAVVTILLGNIIVLVPILLNGHAGTKYGIPFPIIARSSFGVLGANIPALLRALVACGWFGIQSWFGGVALHMAARVIWPSIDDFSIALPQWIGIGSNALIFFLIFWALNLVIIWKGIDLIRLLETVCAPILFYCGIALLAWAIFKINDFDSVFWKPPPRKEGFNFWAFFFPALTGMVGYWSTLSLNISDFTRYARSQKDQLMGQCLGLPISMGLFAFIGVVVTGATIEVYGEAIWDPLQIAQRFDSPVVILLSMIAVLIATLTTNVAANIVGPANDFSNLWPSKIDFRKGGYLTGIVGLLMLPWKLVSDPSGYVFEWLIAYTALLGPVAGILIVDYFVLRRCTLNLSDLYKRQGEYQYFHGFHVAALISMLIGILPNLPGFLVQIHALPESTFPTWLNELYHYAWFLSLSLAATSYGLLAKKPLKL